MPTTVKLAYVGWTNEYKHTPAFSNYLQAKNYINEIAGYSFTDFSYQKRNINTIRIPIPYRLAKTYNYVMYQNDNESPVFAFITDYEEKGDDQTNITIETDVLTTYAGSYKIQPSFVEREHVNDDTVGLHTVPENLECGEYVVAYQSNVSELKKCDIVIGSTLFDNSNTGELENAWGVKYTGMYSGIKYYAVDSTKVNMLNEWLKKFADAGKTDGITCMFMAPKFLINNNDTLSAVVGVYPTDNVASMDYEIHESDVAGDMYKPKNNKLNCYPYKYLLCANNNGGTAIYQYEHFLKGLYRYCFRIEGCLTPGGSIRMTPLYYKGSAISNDEEGINLGKYPICNWTSDEYTNWLTQNSVNIGLNIVSGVGQIVAGVATAVGTSGAGGVVGGSMVVSGVSTIGGQLSQIHQMSFTAPQSHGNINCGDVITASEKNTFFFYGMSIKDEYAKIIDNYFDMFGYKCGRVKVPNKNHRANWWFTKTIDVNITMNAESVNIPSDHMQKIKECYNNGITFWVNPGNMYDYSQDNTIV